MASFNRELLHIGYVPAASGDIYSPSSVDALIHNILLHNKNASTETITLNYSSTSVDYQILKVDLEANDTLQWDFINEGLVLEDAYKIVGNTSTSSEVTIIITGTEETT